MLYSVYLQTAIVPIVVKPHIGKSIHVSLQQEERMRAVVVAAGGPAVERSGGGSGLFPDGAADAIKEDIDGENEDGGGDGGDDD